MGLRSLKRGASACVASLAVTAVNWAFATSSPLAGLSIDDAIAVLERDGLRIFYSTDLVRPWMRVQFEPAAQEPAAALAEILAPLGLATRPGPNGAVLVVRSPDETAEREPGDADAGDAPGAPVDAPRPLEEVVVAASQHELRRAIGASQAFLSNLDLEYLPDIGDDAIRAVSRLPGTASNGLGALANIRGGDADETLVRLDGLRLYDPFHLKDFQSVFSTIDPRIVRSIDVYTGGFPATFGDRMSGVIDVQTIPAPQDLYHEIGFTFFNSSFLSSGAFGDDRGEWIASARRSNLDLLYEQFSDQPERPRYTDAFAKIAYEVSDRLKITANVLRSEDDIILSDDLDREEQAQADDRDLYAWITLEHTPSQRFSGRTLVARSALDSRRFGTTEKAGISTGRLTDIRSFSVETIESDWSWRGGDRFLMRFGAAASRLSGRYDYEDEVEFDLLFDLEGAPAQTSRSRSIHVLPQGRQLGLFATLRYDWTDRVATELGLRWDSQSLPDSETLGPRLGVLYAFSDDTVLRASWGRFSQSQAINELQISDGVDAFLEPQRSDHVVLGVEHTFDNGVDMRVEAYDKSMKDIRPRFENLLNPLILLPELKPDRFRLAPSAARARGIEVTFEGPVGPLQWWSTYSRSRVRDRVQGQDVPRSWDQTHALSSGFNWDSAKWNASVGLIYRSGWPTTRVALDDSGVIPIATVAERNVERTDFFRSVDFRVTRKIALARSSLAVSFELTNAFGRTNPCCVEFEIGDEEEAGLLVLDELDYLPRIPSIGLLWKF